jgi:hypothetical protein
MAICHAFRIRKSHASSPLPLSLVVRRHRTRTGGRKGDGSQDSDANLQPPLGRVSVFERFRMERRGPDVAG